MDHSVIRVDGVGVRVPFRSEARFRAQQREQAVAGTRKLNERRLLAALEALLKQSPAPGYQRHQASWSCDIYSIAHEGEVEDILRLMAETPSNITLNLVYDRSQVNLASLIALFGSVEALKLLLSRFAYYGEYRQMFSFAKMRGHKDCLKAVVSSARARNCVWNFTAEQLREGSEEEDSAQPRTVPRLQKFCAAVLAHELHFDIASSASASPSQLWLVLAKSASDEALEHILSGEHLPPQQRSEVLMHLLFHDPQRLSSLLSTGAKVELLMSCDKYWRELAASPQLSLHTVKLYPGQPAFGDVFSVFDTPSEMWRIEPEDTFERQHKIFPECHASVKAKAAATEESHRASIITDRETFHKRMDAFSQGQLKGLNWDNLLALGGSVVACLLPTPFDQANSGEHNNDPTAEQLNQYFTETFGEASDIDLCLYGIDDAALIADKLVEIHAAVVKAIPEVPVTTIFNGESVSFLRHYPYRPIQVMGAFHSITEVLHGIDLDCTAVVFDGENVWALPRAWMAFNRRWNLAHGMARDLYGVRGCPHYEQRLIKYAHRRGFAIVDRSLVRNADGSTILEPSSSQTQDLEALLREPDYSRKFNWVYSYGNDKGERCYPGVGLKLLLLCERYPRLREMVLSLKPLDSVPYGAEWPAAKVIKHLKTFGGLSRWDDMALEEEGNEWRAEFNHFDGYTRYHESPQFVHHSGKVDAGGEGARGGAKEEEEEVEEEEPDDGGERSLRGSVQNLHLMANHRPFLVPHWLAGMLDTSTEGEEEEEEH